MLQAIARARRPATRAASLARLYYSEPAYSQHQSLSEPDTRQAWLFLGSVFPARFASWDPRYLLAQLRQEHILGQIRGILSDVHSHGFKLVSVEPYLKDGSVFVKFNYSSGSGEDVLPDIEAAIRHHFEEKSGIPSLTLFPSASAWITRGKPWIEDLHRFPSPNLYVIFDGPDISEEAIYEAFRPFGYIGDISAPGPIPNTPYRGVSVHFRRFSYAIAARNVNQNTTIGKTRLRTFYNRPVDAHVVRDWITNHPRLSIPLLIFIFGTITYTIFDPIRTVAIEAKMGDWLDYRAFSVYKWLRRNTVDRFAFLGSTHEDEPDESWQQRQEAKDALENYLSDTPSSVAFLHGPQGSGKTRMVNKLLSELKRPTLMIDCAELTHTRSDSHLLSILAGQIGYWPSFPFLSNLNSVIDMATKGLIGQPAGLSATAPEQVKQMLDVALSALQKVGSRRSTPSMKDRIAEKVKPQPEPEAATEKGSGPPGQVSPQPPSKPQPKQEEEHGWIDSARETALKPVRLLFSSKENSSKKDSAPSPSPARKTSHRERNEEVAALPIVVIRNFAAPGVKEDVMDVFARWVAAVAEHKLAHVIVIGDNRESAKAIAKALPSKPLTTIALYDADGATALQFVKQRLREVHVDTEFTPDQIEYVERLGGRASDLASLIYKVRSGQTVEEAVNDIVNRGVSELRKNAFGDDAEDAKSLPWTREQAWAVLKALARANEVPYHDMLVNYPFKGDEGALRQMERSELVTIGTYEGLPSAIRPGKPVYRYVFAKLVNDPIFHATQEIAYNTKLIETAIATIQSSEEELVRLGSISADSSSWYNAKTATKQRAQYLLGKMRAAQDSLEELESVNVQLKKVLKRGS